MGRKSDKKVSMYRKRGVKYFLVISGLIGIFIVESVLLVRVLFPPTQTGPFSITPGLLLGIFIYYMGVLFFFSNCVGFLIYLKSSSLRKYFFGGIATFLLSSLMVLSYFIVVNSVETYIYYQQQILQNKITDAINAKHITETKSTDSIFVTYTLEAVRSDRYLLKIDLDEGRLNDPVKVNYRKTILDGKEIDTSKPHLLEKGIHTLVIDLGLDLEQRDTILNRFSPIGIRFYYLVGDLRGKTFYYKTKEYSSGFYFLK